MASTVRASPAGVPGQEPGQRRPDLGSRSRLRGPRACGTDPAPHPRRRAPSAVDGVRVAASSPVADPLGERVHDLARSPAPTSRPTTPPASRSRNHWAGQVSSDGRARWPTAVSGWSTGRSGRVGGGAARGCPTRSPGRPAAPGAARRRSTAASRASRRAAAARSGAAAAPRRRRCGAARRRARPATAAGRAGRTVLGRARPSSPRNRDGCSPSSSGEATAVTTSRCGRGCRRRRTAAAPRRAARGAVSGGTSPSRADPVGLEQGARADAGRARRPPGRGRRPPGATRGPWTGGR